MSEDEVKYKLNLRSEEVNEILSRPPSWMTRWGITSIFILILICFVISWFIKSPDVITGRFILSTEQPPIKLHSKHTGILQKLNVADGNNVTAGEMIAEIQNTTGAENISYLKKLLPSIRENISRGTLTPHDINIQFNFGEAQTHYNNLSKNHEDYVMLSLDRHFESKKAEMKRQILLQKELLEIGRNQISLFKKQLDNASVKNGIDQKLYEDHVLSKVDYIREDDALTNKLLEYERLRMTNVETAIRVAQQEKELVDLEYEQREKMRMYLQNINESLKNLENFINQWEQGYTIRAPISGKMSYLLPLVESQLVNAHDELFAIIPNENVYLGYIIVEPAGVGKIKIGQRVRLAFHHFPYQQYGKVIGTVTDISLLPNSQGKSSIDTQNNYRITFRLKYGLVSTYRKSIPFTPNMSGIGEIVTDELRFSQRIFYKIRRYLDND